MDKTVKFKIIDFIIYLTVALYNHGIGQEEYFELNETGTIILCNVDSKNNIERIIFYSSVAVYDENKVPLMRK